MIRSYGLAQISALMYETKEWTSLIRLFVSSYTAEICEFTIIYDTI